MGLQVLLSAVLITAISTANLAAQGGTGFTPKEEALENLPEGLGREETFYACTACHGFKLVAAQGMNRAQWDDSLTWMTTRHNMAEIQSSERALILDYLEKHYPPRVPSPGGGWRNPFTQQ